MMAADLTSFGVTRTRRCFMMRMRIWTALLIILLPLGGFAQEILKPANPQADTRTPQENLPPALTHYMGREIAQTMHFAGAPWLTRESRDREEEPAKLMKALKLKPGMTVC